MGTRKGRREEGSGMVECLLKLCYCGGCNSRKTNIMCFNIVLNFSIPFLLLSFSREEGIEKRNKI